MTLADLSKRLLPWSTEYSAVRWVAHSLPSEHINNGGLSEPILREAIRELEDWRPRVGKYIRENELDELIGALEAYILVRGVSLPRN